MRANRFCCKAILKATVTANVEVAMFDSAVYSWASCFELCHDSTLLLQNNDFHLVSKILESSGECNMILLGGNDTHGYGGDLFRTPPLEGGLLVIARNAEE
eukprot:TRINITY_DN3892_c2_g1_i1.p1 TRINITY_DN3892_c2_g1~~TRINITY_DN3892_c2_g1_i1.p1  ORF type:complete len:101 (+),score=9.74 TRINITY_DN3892_c2_g1_i1:163-465(+)